MNLTRYAWLSVAAALLTMGLKTLAWLITGSVGLLSDALESGVNLVAALLALWALTIACRPPDEDHAFGHEKIEYFSGGVEGALILVAAGGIAWAALPRLFAPVQIQEVQWGALLAVLASLINGAVAYILLRAGRKHRSMTLEADARHLLSDVWVGLGIVGGVGLAKLLNLPILDPLVALSLAIYVALIGLRLLYHAGEGLLDPALSAADLACIIAILDQAAHQGVTYHALRSRRAGRSNFVQVHILVPGDWTVIKGHALVENLERQIISAIPGTRILTHLEPLEDPCSFEDILLDREVLTVTGQGAHL